MVSTFTSEVSSHPTDKTPTRGGWNMRFTDRSGNVEDSGIAFTDLETTKLQDKRGNFFIYAWLEKTDFELLKQDDRELRNWLITVPTRVSKGSDRFSFDSDRSRCSGVFQ